MDAPRAWGTYATAVVARGEVPRLRWAVPAAAGYVALVASLVALNLVRIGHPPSFGDLAWLGIAALVVIWLLDLIVLPWPRVIVTLVTATTVAYLVWIIGNGLAPMFLFLLVMWIAYTGSRRDSYVALALSLATLVPFWAQFDISVPWTVGIVSIWLGIQALIAQRRTLSQLRAAQADLATRAAAAERQRIAGEIHDVVAHSLAVTMLHLTGARHILERDPQRAAQALAQAEHLGRQSLADVRRTVGLLQSADAPGSAARAVLAPLPTAADLRALVAEYAAAGMNVCLTIDGDPSELSASVSLAIYRITQEALANVVKHASRAAAEVQLSIDDAQQAVHLRIHDGGGIAELIAPAPGGNAEGMGLPGMRRRAELLGGAFSAGPDPSGHGWVVECTLPATPLPGADTGGE